MTKTEHILISLGRYKYLTITQLLQLGVVSYHATQKLVKKLVDANTLGVIKYAGSVERANFKAENIYYLMPETAKQLEASGYIAQHPKKRSKRIGTDYKHRIFTVNVQMACERWACDRYQVDNFKTYFTNSDNFETATSMRYQDTYIVPDFIMSVTGSKKLYFVGELTNGHEVTLAMNKLKELYECMLNKLFYENYGWEKTPRVLAIMESNDLLRLTLKRIASDPYFDKVHNVFLLNTIDKVCTDFDQWVDMRGNPVRLSESLIILSLSECQTTAS